MPHAPASLKIQERLFRRLRREPAIKLLTAQIHPDRPLKIMTATRTLAIWPGGSTEQWWGELGGTSRTDPHLEAIYQRSHAKSLTFAADYRRWGSYQTARSLIATARSTRLDRGTKWSHLP